MARGSAGTAREQTVAAVDRRLGAVVGDARHIAAAHALAANGARDHPHIAVAGVAALDVAPLTALDIARADASALDDAVIVAAERALRGVGALERAAVGTRRVAGVEPVADPDTAVDGALEAAAVDVLADAQISIAGAVGVAAVTRGSSADAHQHTEHESACERP